MRAYLYARRRVIAAFLLFAAVFGVGVPSAITTLLSRDGINVENLSNKSRGDYAYTIVDLSAPADQSVLGEVTALENVIRVRVIQ